MFDYFMDPFMARPFSSVPKFDKLLLSPKGSLEGMYKDGLRVEILIEKGGFILGVAEKRLVLVIFFNRHHNRASLLAGLLYYSGGQSSA